ncbi:hypothetical protein C8J57DRAFT_1252187 [Mycena rebaudengoi]|nr:hypothetical protein C8J57DRAFT_1534716 [Mycena rebaudengoi]KAJ7227951.1 hypothetical protein C8J57DRAFT_1252187 [Mycena rebaudengoi]
MTGDSAVRPGQQHDHVRPRRLLADAAIRNNAAIHDAGRDATHADGEDLYFYTLVPSPVSSASTSSGSATSESCSASEESTSESDSEGEEEGYDAQAYTERTTDFAMRHTPAAADFAQPRAHRPMVCLSSRTSAASDNGRESDERDAELTAPTITPSTTPAAATRHKGCAGCASSLPRRSPNPPRMRTGRSSSRSQYGCVGGGYAGRWGVQSRGRRLCGWEVVAAEVSGCGAAGGGVSGWGAAAAVDALDAVHDAATPATGTLAAAHSTHSICCNTRHTSTSGTPPRMHARRCSGRPRTPRTRWPGTGSGRRHGCRALWTWSGGVPGVGEVVPSHAPQVPSHGLAPPAHTHIPSHTLP